MSARDPKAGPTGATCPSCGRAAGAGHDRPGPGPGGMHNIVCPLRRAVVILQSGGMRTARASA
jgi:hypothetical protein